VGLFPVEELECQPAERGRRAGAQRSRQHHGLGHFLTREDLAKQEGRRMSDIVALMSGVGIVQGRADRGWIVSRRYIIPLNTVCIPGREQPNGSVYVPSTPEKTQGMKCACYAQVYVDGALMNPGKPTEPFDVNTIPPSQIEAVEWYSSPSQTPPRYARLNSACGVYVMHTRRPDG
jgi:hypothetical protein